VTNVANGKSVVCTVADKDRAAGSGRAAKPTWHRHQLRRPVQRKS
jgi:hypothetical protein